MSFERKNQPSNPLDDVARRPPNPHWALKIENVGVENVQTQIRLGSDQVVPAKATASVSLVDEQARGIHMSRLFKLLNQLHTRELSWEWLEQINAQLLASQGSLSKDSVVAVDFELPTLRPALLSDEMGWRHYPLRVQVDTSHSRRTYTLTTRILYSSTCPCSTGLSRQAIQEQFKSEFAHSIRDGQLSADAVMAWLGGSDAVATPHSQRSEAIGTLIWNELPSSFQPLKWIDEMETALGTPVQAAVKRVDEQEFARRNAQNLMFCEDAARKLKSSFLKFKEVTDFVFEVRHFESLHPHDVVARIRKHD